MYSCWGKKENNDKCSSIWLIKELEGKDYSYRYSFHVLICPQWRTDASTKVLVMMLPGTLRAIGPRLFRLLNRDLNAVPWRTSLTRKKAEIMKLVQIRDYMQTLHGDPVSQRTNLCSGISNLYAGKVGSGSANFQNCISGSGSEKKLDRTATLVFRGGVHKLDYNIKDDLTSSPRALLSTPNFKRQFQPRKRKLDFVLIG